jgi:hypothetical protein
MNINNIKTRKDFYQVADVWYNRTHNLRCVWQNDLETESRKVKAYRLWFEMYQRMMNLVNINIQLNQSKGNPSKNAIIIKPPKR